MLMIDDDDDDDADDDDDDDDYDDDTKLHWSDVYMYIGQHIKSSVVELPA